MNTTKHARRTAVAGQVERGVRRRWRLTGNERWTDTVVSSETKEHAAKGEVYKRTTKTVTQSVREVELECGHWSPYRYNGGLQYTYYCAQCEDA